MMSMQPINTTVDEDLLLGELNKLKSPFYFRLEHDSIFEEDEIIATVEINGRYWLFKTKSNLKEPYSRKMTVNIIAVNIMTELKLSFIKELFNDPS